MKLAYPGRVSERDLWITDQRPPRSSLDARKPYGFFNEQERSGDGRIVSVNTILLTNRECPWRCVMCDLWKNTLTDTVASGSIVAQIDFALERLPAAEHIKLYNSGSFFDPGAIPREDYPAIGNRLQAFERIIVESHPALIQDSTTRFRDLLRGQLEVAMGLETAQESVLRKLNKRMTLHMFESAAAKLRAASIDLRAFILIQPPFSEPSEALYWTQRSVNFAFDCGASAATLIPVRSNNGAMEELQADGHFSPPDMKTIESALELGIQLRRGRVFVDLWDLQAGACECHAHRVERLRRMNLEQQIHEPIACACC